MEVADVFRDGESAFVGRYGATLCYEQRQVLRAVIQCRTAALGGHRQMCDDCGHEAILYNSCRNRHCPKCQAMARAAWLEDRQSELLPIPYFHVVFTLPQQLAPLALQNKRVLYGMLFRAAAETLMELAADPKHLGAKIGCLMVLHSWGQTLMHHPHVHCLVTGGGISLDRSRWITCKQSKRSKRLFFVHVKILSRVFRGKFIDLLKQAFSDGHLRFHGKLAPLTAPKAFEQCLNASVKKDWVVYAKRPFSSPRCVLKYLARYTHRVAISQRRLLDLKDGRVSFEYKDYADEDQVKVMTLDSSEFIRRFLMHTLPNGFVRIRYYGLLANRHRQEQLEQCRRLLGVQAQLIQPADVTKSPELDPDALPAQNRCPVCKRGHLIIVELMYPTYRIQPPRPHFLIKQPTHALPDIHGSRSPP
jgi:hypothetical protein